MERGGGREGEKEQLCAHTVRGGERLLVAAVRSGPGWGWNDKIFQ